MQPGGRSQWLVEGAQPTSETEIGGAAAAATLASSHGLPQFSIEEPASRKSQRLPELTAT